MRKKWKYSLGVLGAIISAMAAILVHALLPSPGAATNPEMFDGYLVQIFGFPFVASMYFVLLYLHILVVFFMFGEKSRSRNVHIGLNYGLAFALMYLIGMQEVVVEGSPLDVYGQDFISYQFFMGLGDAIPVFCLCMILALYINKRRGKKVRNIFVKEKIIRMLVIGICFFGERTVRYYIGFIDSDIHQYPIPVLIWTAVMGLVFGIMNLLLESVHPVTSGLRKNVQINAICIGINWIWFNCFMGLILKDTFIKMFLRGGIDVLFLIVGAISADYILKKIK